jgi:hypothetical protein
MTTLARHGWPAHPELSVKGTMNSQLRTVRQRWIADGKSDKMIVGR